MGIMKKSKKKDKLSLNTLNVMNVAKGKKQKLQKIWYIIIANRPLVMAMTLIYIFIGIEYY